MQIVTELEELVDHYRPQALSMEGVFFSKNVHSSLVLGHIRGAILVMCRRRGMEFFEYGAASKEKVALLVRSRLGIKGSEDVKLDATDALAIACTHLFPQNEFVRKTPSRKSAKTKTLQWKELIVKMGGELPK